MTAAAEPLYADSDARLFLGDARELHAWLEADVLIVDPPYGRQWRQGQLSASRSHAGIAGDRDTTTRDALLSLWGPSRRALVFGDLMLPAPSGTRQVLVYRKPPNAGTRGAVAGFRRDLEAVYVLGMDWPAGIGGRSSLLTTAAPSAGNPSSPAGQTGHPHAKPLDVMCQLADLMPPGATIADPCAGSGSTLVAARLTGRPSVGVEVDPGHAETARRRLSQGVLL